jgi:hypothetical protein
VFGDDARVAQAELRWDALTRALTYRGKPFGNWHVDEIAGLASEEPFARRGDRAVPGPLRGLHSEMLVFEAETVGDLPFRRVMAHVVLLGILPLREALQLAGEAPMAGDGGQS